MGLRDGCIGSRRTKLRSSMMGNGTGFSQLAYAHSFTYLLFASPSLTNRQQTPIAMTGPLIHLNASVFPAPETFDPSRWLDNASLDKYLVCFSRGPRACVGLNLAWAELYFAVAGVVGKYGCEGEGRGPSMKLWNTDVDDVVLKHDFFVPGQSEETAKKGILVQVCG